MSSNTDLDRKIDERISKNEEQQEASEIANLLIEGTDMFDEDDREDLESAPVTLLRKLADEKVSGVAANLAAQRASLSGDPDDWPSNVAGERGRELASQEDSVEYDSDAGDWPSNEAGARSEERRP